MNSKQKGKLMTRFLMLTVIILLIGLDAIPSPVLSPGTYKTTRCFGAWAAPAPPVMPDEQERMQKMRAAGLHGNRSQIPYLLAVLRNPPTPDHALVAMHALAQLGASQALPVLDSIIAQGQRQPLYILNQAKVAKARLLAESSTRNIFDSRARTVNKAQHFIAATGLNQTSLTSAISAAQSQSDAATQDIKTPPAEVFALRDLADMAYLGQPGDATVLPTISRLNFQTDYPSALKLYVAGLSPAARLDWLVQDLAHKKRLTSNDYYEIVLAADLGTLASQAAVQQLYAMEKHPNDYTYVGYNALFQVIRTVGYPQQNLWAHFDSSPDPKVRYEAQGGNRVIVPGY